MHYIIISSTLANSVIVTFI